MAYERVKKSYQPRTNNQHPKGANGTFLTETMAHAEKICRILKTIYPDVKTGLHYKNTFELLIATILSAQCTDAQVNSATKNLFKKLPTPHDLAGAPIEIIEELIRSTGFFHNKARNIKNSSKSLVEKYKSMVPDKLDELIKLPGVGRKTANVVLGVAFGVPGIVVDTHVSRLSRRLGLTENKDPVKIEFDLMKVIPKKEWNNFSLQLINFGRAVCKARKPDCASCPLYTECGKERGRNNFHNYASQLQVEFVRSQIPKILK